MLVMATENPRSEQGGLSQSVALCFQIDQETYGEEQMFLTGDIPELGCWDKCRALGMCRTEEGLWETCWVTSVDVARKGFNYQYFVRDAEGLVTLEPEKRSLQVENASKCSSEEMVMRVTVEDFWDRLGLTQIRLGCEDAAQFAMRKCRSFQALCEIQATIEDLPDEILHHIFSYLDVDDHLYLPAVNRRWRSMYDDPTTWKLLLKQHFGRSRLVCGCVTLPSYRQHFCRSGADLQNSKQQSWKEVFIKCTKDARSMDKGQFAPVRQYQYKVDTVHSHISMVSRQLYGNYYIMERRVEYEGVTVFSFREIESGAVVLTWKAPLPFDDFHPIRNRIHCDLEIYGDLVMLVYYKNDRSIRKVFCWHVPRDLAYIPANFDPEKYWQPPKGKTAYWVRFRPPCIAVVIDGRLQLWDVDNNKCLWAQQEATSSPVACAAWDDQYIVSGSADGSFKINFINSTGPSIKTIVSGRDLHGKYLGFYRRGSVFKIFAALGPRAVLEVDQDSRVKVIQIPRWEAEEEDEETFLPPSGVVVGGAGPFMAMSNSRDIYWYRSHKDEQPQRLDLDAALESGSDDTEMETVGLRRVMLADNHLVTIFTDYDAKTSTVTVLEPHSANLSV